MLLCLQYNNWFTFSEYEEPVTVRSCRPIHARELAMVGIGSFVSIILLSLRLMWMIPFLSFILLL